MSIWYVFPWCSSSSVIASQIIQTLFRLLYFLHMTPDAFDSISDYLTLMFPENFWISWFYLRGSHSLSARRAQWTKSRGPKCLQLKVRALLVIIDYQRPTAKQNLLVSLWPLCIKFLAVVSLLQSLDNCHYLMIFVTLCQSKLLNVQQWSTLRFVKH